MASGALVVRCGRSAGIEVSFLSNIDGQAFDDAVRRLDPATTLVVVASKTFTTLETLANMEAALAWLSEAGVPDPQGRLIAVTAKPEAAVSAGIDETRVLQFDEGVGGRYSLWSAVGVSAALALGWDAFEALLEGAAAMDRHFRFAAPAGNLPLLAAFADRLYAKRLGWQTRGCSPMTRARLLPLDLQQLEMESNGKCAGGRRRLTVLARRDLGRQRPTRACVSSCHRAKCGFDRVVAVAEGEDARIQTKPSAVLNAFAQGRVCDRPRQDDPRAVSGQNRPSASICATRSMPHPSRVAPIARTFAMRCSRINPSPFGVERAGIARDCEGATRRASIPRARADRRAQL